MSAIIYCLVCDNVYETSQASPFTWAGRDDVIDNCYRIFRAYSYDIDLEHISDWVYGSKSKEYINQLTKYS